MQVKIGARSAIQRPCNKHAMARRVAHHPGGDCSDHHPHREPLTMAKPARTPADPSRGPRNRRGAASKRPTRSSSLGRRWPPHDSMDEVSARQLARFLGAAVVTTCAMLNAACSGSSSDAVSTSSTLRVNGKMSADECPDIEVVFARGRNEPPGVGYFGQAFVDSLRSQVGGRSLGVYAVNYAAADPAPGASPEGRRHLRRR